MAEVQLNCKNAAEKPEEGPVADVSEGWICIVLKLVSFCPSGGEQQSHSTMEVYFQCKKKRWTQTLCKFLQQVMSLPLIHFFY